MLQPRYLVLVPYPEIQLSSRLSLCHTYMHLRTVQYSNIHLPWTILDWFIYNGVRLANLPSRANLSRAASSKIPQRGLCGPDLLGMCIRVLFVYAGTQSLYRATQIAISSLLSLIGAGVRSTLSMSNVWHSVRCKFLGFPFYFPLFLSFFGG